MRTADGFEVDFLARYPAGEEELNQVCSDLEEANTKVRELRALIAVGGEHRSPWRALDQLERRDLALHRCSDSIRFRLSRSAGYRHFCMTGNSGLYV
jgi:hypothetical protein